MKTKFELELADVKRIAAAAEAEALKNQWAVTIAIVDDGGHLLGGGWGGGPPFPRTLRPPRRTRRRLGRRESKVYEDVINGGRTSFPERTCRGGHARRRCAYPEGRPVPCLGAVGVSGVKSSEDAQIARAGIAAIGL